jgi:chemotaxis protein CheX
MRTAIQQGFVDELVSATCDVFKTMVFTEVSAAGATEREALQSGAKVVGTVGFTGKTSGLVLFHSTIDDARLITASMLGMEPAAVNGEMPDAIGELTNMIAGSFRTRVAATHGETWAISVPSVTVGSDFRMKIASNVQRVLVPFRMGRGEVFVELIVTRRTAA